MNLQHFHHGIKMITSSMNALHILEKILTMDTNIWQLNNIHFPEVIIFQLKSYY